MNNRRNYYRILHVQPDAPLAVIKASYRAQMQKLKLHPDLGGDVKNAATINEAYATLSNEKKRAAYDAEFTKPGKSHRSDTIKRATSSTHTKPTSASRSLNRQLKNTPLYYFTKPNYPPSTGVLRDLSPTGVQIQTTERLASKQVIKLSCDELTATVRVMYCRKSTIPGHYNIGAEFLSSHFNKKRGTFFSAVVS